MLSVLRTTWPLLLGILLLMVGNGMQGTLLGIRGKIEGISTTQMSVVMSAYFGGFLLILRNLRMIFRTLTQGDPFKPENVRRLRQIGLTLAVVTAGVWVAQGMVAARLAPGVMDPQGIGELLTPIFSVLVVFVLAEVFREGARLRRESELTI